MRSLILVGTGFLGYRAAAEALEAGHDVSAFALEGKAPLHATDQPRYHRESALSAEPILLSAGFSRESGV